MSWHECDAQCGVCAHRVLNNHLPPAKAPAGILRLPAALIFTANLKALCIQINNRVAFDESSGEHLRGVVEIVCWVLDEIHQ